MRSAFKSAEGWPATSGPRWAAFLNVATRGRPCFGQQRDMSLVPRRFKHAVRFAGVRVLPGNYRPDGAHAADKEWVHLPSGKHQLATGQVGRKSVPEGEGPLVSELSNGSFWDSESNRSRSVKAPSPHAAHGMRWSDSRFCAT